GATAVHPTSFGADAPSYMPAVAVGEFTKLSLGTTAAGTEVSVWYLPGGATDATTGTQNLLGAFDFYEQTLGTYLFGGEVGSVSANWGGGDYGGMEHHPYWHVSSGSMYHEITHAHEAAHGWYGNGVRIGCWEDFVLSEGTTTYLAARGLASQGYDAWPEYECSLKYTCEQANTVALPDDSCNVIDIISHPLWGPAPYYKGAYFYRGVAMVIGEAALDVALGEFYAAHAAGSARMQDMIDHLKSKADTAGAAQIDQLVSDWLRSTACPVDPATLCL
ncbi:MAG: peptidase M1, partial [Myxococcales bacterium]|nr:peptidase M1 [Myxococcales bacterium]